MWNGRAGAQQTPDLSAPLRFDSSGVRMGTLPNGLRYFVRRNDKPAKRAELRLVVKAGSMHEDDDQRGLAHFVEHMAFNGTAHFPKHWIIEYLRSIGVRFGSDLNANTTAERTLYILPIPTDTARQITQAIRILADWAHGVTFDSAEFEAERGVVMGEWRSRLGAGSRLLDREYPVLYQGSRYPSRLPIGDTTIILHAPVSSVRRFYRDWYRPDLMAVVAVGDFDPDAMVRQIRAVFGAIPAAPHRRAAPDMRVPVVPGKRVLVLRDPEVPTPSLSVMAMRAEPERWTVGSVRDGIARGLFMTLVNQRLGEIPLRPDAPFLNAGIGESPIAAGVVARQIGVTVSDSGLSRALDATMAEIDRVAEHGFTTSELDRARQRYLAGLENAERNKSAIRSGTLAEQYVGSFLSGAPVTSPDDDIALSRRLLATITPDELRAMADEWHGLNDRLTVVTLPERAAAQAADTLRIAAALDAPRRGALPAYAEAIGNAPLIEHLPTPGTITSRRAYADVGITEWRLSNGITVLLKPTRYVTGQLAIKSWAPGGFYNAPDSDATTSIVSNLLVGTSGAGQYDMTGLRKRLGASSVSVSRAVSSTDRSLNGQSTWTDAEALFQVLYLAATQPRYDSAEFALVLQRAKESAAANADDPQRVFRDTISATLMRHSVWSRPATPAVIDSIDPKRAFDLVKARFANMGDFVFAIVGDFALDSIEPYVLQYLATLPAAGYHEPVRDVGIRPPNGVTTRTVRAGREPQAQTQLIFYGPYTTSVAENAVFNEMVDVLKARLMGRLREQLAGTYTVGVEGGYQLQPVGLYSVTISFISAPERRRELTDAVFDELRTLQRDGVRPEEIQRVHEEYLRQMQEAQQSNGFWLNRILRFAREGRPFDALLDTRAITDVTPAMVQDAARRYLDARQYAHFELVPGDS